MSRGRFLLLVSSLNSRHCFVGLFVGETVAALRDMGCLGAQRDPMSQATDAVVLILNKYHVQVVKTS